MNSIVCPAHVNRLISLIERAEGVALCTLHCSDDMAVHIFNSLLTIDDLLVEARKVAEAAGGIQDCPITGD